MVRDGLGLERVRRGSVLQPRINLETAESDQGAKESELVGKLHTENQVCAGCVFPFLSVSYLCGISNKETAFCNGFYT